MLSFISSHFIAILYSFIMIFLYVNKWLIYLKVNFVNCDLVMKVFLYTIVKFSWKFFIMTFFF